MSIRAAFWLFALFTIAPVQHVWASGANREELDRLRDQISRLTATLNQDKTELNSLHGELARVESAMQALNRSIYDTQTDISGRAARIRASEAEIARIDAELVTQRAQLKNIIVASYISGRAEYLKLLLNQENPGDVGRFLTYYRYLSQHRADDILEFEDTVEHLRRTRAGLTSEQAELKLLEEAQLSQRRELVDALRTRNSVVAALEQGIGSKQQRLEHMKQDERRLQHLLQGIGDAAPNASGPDLRFGRMRGKLSMPLRGSISAHFGETRWGTDIPWQGIFVGAAEGTEVSAIFPGRVAFADWLRGYGLLVILDHGDGFMSLYSHNQLLFKQVGEWVEMGESIALVGSSGGQTNAGLYFEVRKNGEPLNPLIWCKVE